MSKMIDNTNTRCEVVSFASTALSISDRSRGISKIKPKIRIIHIIAPEIIKTDTKNFRELVQSLTGKSSIRRKSRRNSNKNVMGCSSGTSTTGRTRSSNSDLQNGMQILGTHHHDHENPTTKRVLLKNEILIKDEIYQPWEGDAMINTDFGGFFSDMDSLINTDQDLGGFPSMFSGKPSSNVNLFNGALC